MSNPERPEKLRATAFDGLAAALSPALIIGMIGSLIFFLVIAFYRGQYDIRLMFILGLFTVAIVLVARIAIESDRARAAAFALPLAIAAMLGMARFVTISGELAPLGWVINVGLLALAWYLADRITFDCTLLEEDRESLQGGLLQTIGASVADAAGKETNSKLNAPVGARQPIGAGPLKKAKHNPGVWVLYFALIAFPLFGVGQLVIPDERQRSIAFWCLIVYLACALSLLMTTSLLGMRRYLRQRGAAMPPEITAKWLMAGALITVAILLACLLMPLPGKQLSVAGLKIELTSPDNLTTSRFGIGRDGQPNDQPDGQPGSKGEQGKGEQGKGEQGKGEQGKDAAQSDASGEKGQNNQEPGNQQPGKSPEQSKGQPQSQDKSGDSASSNNSDSKPQSDSNSKGNKTSPSDQGQPSKPDAAAKDRQPQRPDQQRPDQQRPDQQRPDQQRPDQQRPDQQRPDQQRPDQQRPDQQRPDQAKPPGDEAANDQQRKPDAQQPPAQPPPANQPNDAPSEPLRAGNSLSQASRSIARSLADLMSSLGSLFKWLLIAVLAGIVLFYVATHFEEVRRLIVDLINFIQALMGRRGPVAAEPQVEAQPAASEPARRPFSSFANPFAKGLKGWGSQQVVLHTFAALEAWAAQRGRVRAVDQTAEEFARGLVHHEPELDRFPLQAASMLDRVMFAGWDPKPQEIAALGELWDRMRG